ncbi:bifunctional coenzyme A synthase-like [Clavelina lepadiformis]|uniref:Cytidyltransferase-like domain-containing protein n=1 Tax=Clavelina lepadiformis TaxID=159417 RepID=A0ABP0F815_CLALP
MHRTGLLILTNHVSSLCNGDYIKHIVAGVKRIIKSTLYVHLENTSPVIKDARCLASLENFQSPVDVSSSRSEHATFSKDVFPFLSKFYSEAAMQCSNLDVNILLHNIGNCKHEHKLSRPIQCIIVDSALKPEDKENSSQILQRFVMSRYQQYNYQTIPVVTISDALNMQDDTATKTTPVTSKGSVVIGGTFDHVHIGHKVLLSEATLMANRRLLIGLTDGKMLERKTLHELIKPWSLRKKQLENFLCDVADYSVKTDSGNINLNGKKLLEIARITDPIGPSSTDPDLQCIAVSKETEKGGEIVNKARLENGLNLLHVHLIGEGHLLGENQTSAINEVKTSSSTLRYNSLGDLRKIPNSSEATFPSEAYVIGLTGGIASGKSSIAKRMEKLGAVIIDCDKLGHKAYKPGTKTFSKVVERFGSDIVAASGIIDRQVLSQKVFGNAQEKSKNLQDLNSLVWPEIKRLATIQVEEAIKGSEGRKLGTKLICVLDAAVLLEAGWDAMTNEVWVCTVPPSEAIKRIQERDGRSQEDAEMRIQAQMNNKERVARAHVVLSTFWSPDATQLQVEKAWKRLEERLQPDWSYDSSLF